MIDENRLRSMKDFAVRRVLRGVGAQGLRLAPRLDIQPDGPTALRIGAMFISGE
jgi:hypothetical protein